MVRKGGRIFGWTVAAIGLTGVVHGCLSPDSLPSGVGAYLFAAGILFWVFPGRLP